MSDDQHRILITSATGHTGRLTTALLLQRGYAVRALARQDSDRARELAAAGAEVIFGDARNFHDMSHAMRGVNRAYLCYPIREGLLEATAVFAETAIEAGVRSVVNMSQISARPSAESNAARQHWLSERLLDRSKLQVTHLRPTFFTFWLSAAWDYSQGRGVLRLPFGNGRHAPVAEEDLAQVIAAILAEPEPHAGQTYTLYGSVEMNHHEIAEAMSNELGFPVTYDPIDVDTFTAVLIQRGFPAHLVQHFGHVAIDYQNGVFAGINRAVEEITGRAPMTVPEFVAQNREVFHSRGGFFVPTSVS